MWRSGSKAATLFGSALHGRLAKAAPRHSKEQYMKKARRFLPSAAPNYTHRRKGVFNAKSIEDPGVTGNVRYRTGFICKQTLKNGKQVLFVSGSLSSTTNEELETNNEELQATNEELRNGESINTAPITASVVADGKTDTRRFVHTIVPISGPTGSTINRLFVYSEGVE